MVNSAGLSSGGSLHARPGRPPLAAAQASERKSDFFFFLLAFIKEKNKRKNRK